MFTGTREAIFADESISGKSGFTFTFEATGSVGARCKRTTTAIIFCALVLVYNCTPTSIHSCSFHGRIQGGVTGVTSHPPP